MKNHDFSMLERERKREHQTCSDDEREMALFSICSDDDDSTSLYQQRKKDKTKHKMR